MLEESNLFIMSALFYFDLYVYFNTYFFNFNFFFFLTKKILYAENNSVNHFHRNRYFSSFNNLKFTC